MGKKFRPRLSKEEKELLDVHHRITEPAKSRTFKVGDTVYWRQNPYKGQKAGRILEVSVGGRGILLSSQGVGKRPKVSTIGKRRLTYAVYGKTGLRFGSGKDFTKKKPAKKKPKRKRKR